jgi:hypothetical protein
LGLLQEPDLAAPIVVEVCGRRQPIAVDAMRRERRVGLASVAVDHDRAESWDAAAPHPAVTNDDATAATAADASLPPCMIIQSFHREMRGAAALSCLRLRASLLVLVAAHSRPLEGSGPAQSA